jgi:hypothetical protein
MERPIALEGELDDLTSLEKAKDYIRSLSRSLQKRYEHEKELEARIEKAIAEWERPLDGNGTGLFVQRGNKMVSLLRGEGK